MSDNAACFLEAILLTEVRGGGDRIGRDLGLHSENGAILLSGADLE